MSLVLDSLEIKNFRAFKHLRIEKLARVNLIVGKNNVGKSSVLEALWLYATNGKLAIILSLLGARDEGLWAVGGQATTLSERLNSFRHLFYGRHSAGSHSGPIKIGAIGSTNNTLIIDFARAGTVIRRGDNNKWQMFSPVSESPNHQFTHFFVSDKDDARLYPLGANSDQVAPSETTQLASVIFASANGINKSQTNDLWDAVALTPLEDDVVTSLRVISPEIERISLIGGKEPFVPRNPIVRTSTSDYPIPLRSMGEGMNRMLGIALALVNAKDGMLLIDEVDTGLHYSVLPDLWKLIFEVAHRLNVQVFATSHSWDCIEAFQQAADNTEEEGILVRLENRKDGVGAVTFDEHELAIVTREQIEVR